MKQSVVGFVACPPIYGMCRYTFLMILYIHDIVMCHTMLCHRLHLYIHVNLNIDCTPDVRQPFRPNCFHLGSGFHLGSRAHRKSVARWRELANSRTQSKKSCTIISVFTWLWGYRSGVCKIGLKQTDTTPLCLCWAVLEPLMCDDFRPRGFQQEIWLESLCVAPNLIEIRLEGAFHGGLLSVPLVDMP